MEPNSGGMSSGNSPRCQEALDSAIASVARVFGRDDEVEAFIKTRNAILNSINEPDAHAQIRFEEYEKSIPYWIKALEGPMYRLYEAGLADAREWRREK